jgi:hemerythrin-like metal-binding protein
MPIMHWDDSLDVGVVAMNREHQQILDVMNRIYDESAKGVQGDRINALVAELGQVCVSHFADEERYMERTGYPELDRHRQLHARLLAQVQQYADAIKAAHGRPPAEFFNFLKFWLTSHIKGIDVKYAAHAHRAA